MAQTNQSFDESKKQMLWEAYRRRNHFDPVSTLSTPVISAFAFLILFGVIGNGFVIYVVARNSHMARNPRNLFIVNLALSDLILCLFTQPFNVLKLTVTAWPLGPELCKFVPMLTGTNVFVSTISITAIALDRFQMIVYPTAEKTKRASVIIALLAVWTISLLAASPLLVFNEIVRVEPVTGMVLFEACVEVKRFDQERKGYTISAIAFQYVVPIVIVVVAHVRICLRLHYRLNNHHYRSHQPYHQQLPGEIHIPKDNLQSHTQLEAHQNPWSVSSLPPPPPPHSLDGSNFRRDRILLASKRKRRTNLLLAAIALVFALSWMPLNIVNVVIEYEYDLVVSFNRSWPLFSLCHLMVLGSACANPVLYGWLNNNFRKEFLKILRASWWSLRQCCACCCTCCIATASPTMIPGVEAPGALVGSTSCGTVVMLSTRNVSRQLGPGFELNTNLLRPVTPLSSPSQPSQGPLPGTEATSGERAHLLDVSTVVVGNGGTTTNC